MKKMKNTIKFIAMALTALMLLVIGANAAPVITDVSIDKSGVEDVVLVSFVNTNTTSGIYTGLSFQIEGLGTVKNMGILTIDTNQILQYKLSDVTDSLNLLKQGSTYNLIVRSDNSVRAKSFLYGSFKDTTGLGLVLDSIKVNGEEVQASNTLQVMNGETLKVNLKVSALSNFDNARFTVFIEGYEHSPIVASTDIFSVIAGKTYVKSLDIKLPSDMNSLQDYKLRITGANDLSGITYKDFSVYVDTQRNRVDILDLIMTPSSAVEAGQNIVASVRMKNRGQKSQSSVKVTVEIPELGISESSYVSNLNNLETITSGDMLLFVPVSAKAKSYDVKVTLQYNDGYSGNVKTYPITVVAAKQVVEKNLLVNLKDNVNLVAGVTTSFPVVIANPNSNSRAISIASANNAWATVEVSPSLAMVKGGDSQTFTVSVTPKAAIAGTNSLSLDVKDAGNVISAVKVSTYVAPSSKISWTNLVLVVLLIVAIIVLLSIVIKIAKKRNDDDGDEELTSSKEYY